MKRRGKDYRGRKYGHLTPLYPTGGRDKRGKILWLVRCDCGTQRTINTCELSRVRHCSHKCPLTLPSQGTHQLSNSPAYYSWKGMLQRCQNPKDPSYYRYGQIGISVCDRWQKFENFIADMGQRPEGTTLDREDTFGNYEPGNCRWADRETQANNRRVQKLYSYQGVSLNVRQWARKFGINRHTLSARVITCRWSIEKALTTPVGPPRRKHAEAVQG